MGLSLAVLAGFGALVGVFMRESSEQPLVGARARSEVASDQRFVESMDTMADDEFDEDAPISGDLDLGGGERLGDDEYAADAAGTADQDQDQDEDDDNEGHEEEVDDDTDDETLIARGRELVERRVAAITAEADGEAVDAGWARAMEIDIADEFAAHGPPGSRLVSTTCKTTLCITEIELPPDYEGSGSMSWLASVGLTRGFFVHDQSEPGAGARTMAYLPREGYTLP